MPLRHDIPAEFTDEDRWFKFFTKKSLVYIAFGCFITFLLYRLFSNFGYALTGVAIGLFITAVLAFISMFELPGTAYLSGGGLTLDILLKRLYIRKRSKVIYIKGYKGGKTTK